MYLLMEVTVTLYSSLAKTKWSQCDQSSCSITNLQKYKGEKNHTNWHAKDAQAKFRLWETSYMYKWKQEIFFKKLEKEFMNLKLIGSINEYIECSATSRELKLLM